MKRNRSLKRIGWVGLVVVVVVLVAGWPGKG